MSSPIAATRAYAQVASLGDPSSLGGGLAKGIGGAAGGGANFGDMLKDALGQITATGQKSDAQAQAMATGKANVVDVVTAVAETEVAIDALVAVRDRVIQAYEEILRMPI